MISVCGYGPSGWGGDGQSRHENMVMEWLEYEQKEHEDLSNLMEQLELEYGGQRKECEGTEDKLIVMNYVEMKPTVNDEINDILEHTILDKLLEEWVDETNTELENNMTIDENDCGQESENDCASTEIDECVTSAKCGGGCVIHSALIPLANIFNLSKIPPVFAEIFDFSYFEVVFCRGHLYLGPFCSLV